MPENWKTYKLKDIVDQDRGISYGIVQPGRHDPDGVPILKINNLTGNSFNINELHFVSKKVEEKYKKTRLRGGELLVSLVGSLGEVYTVPIGMIGYNVVRALAVIPVLKEFSPDWVMYYLRAPFAQNILQQIATTSVQATINLKELREINIPFPEKKERDSIASILSALDDKIELNLQMNKTLEEMAMALYKHWFIDFGPFQDGEFVDSELGQIPKGWEVKRLDEISFVKGGKRLPKGAQLQNDPNSHPYLRVKDFNSTYLNVSGMEYVPDDVFSSISNYIVNTGDMVLSIVGTIGKVALIGEDLNLASLTENCVKITPKTETIFSEIIYLQLTSKNGQDEIQSKTVGSTQPKLPIYNINSLNLAFPSDFKEVKEIAIELQNWFKIIYNNTIENQTLTQLRDTLLPKLISGEVRVKDVEKTFSEVL